MCKAPSTHYKQDISFIIISKRKLENTPTLSGDLDSYQTYHACEVAHHMFQNKLEVVDRVSETQLQVGENSN